MKKTLLLTVALACSGADAQANYYSCRSNLLELNLKGEEE